MAKVDDDRLPAHTKAAPYDLKREVFVGFLAVHAIAALAFFPWFFSWTGVVLFLLGVQVFGTLGINIGYHRLLTHRSFSCPLWLERTLAVLGACCLEFPPAYWAAIHRRHHQFSDEEQDPHTPLVSFLWAHFVWLIERKPADMKPRQMTEKYAKDLMRDPLYAMLEQKHNWIRLSLIVWIPYFVIGFAIAVLTGSDASAAFQFGASLLVWGAAFRTVAVWHTAWSVNSVTHVWGYRTYETPDSSRNNPIVGIFGAGEGWHNNHHADPRSARHGHQWWELDLSWLIIRLLMRLGLATKVAMPSTRSLKPAANK